MTKNKVLALKYRPQEFKDLIGQETMTQTITNAIELGKTPNAYLLTGIRGVGKTTTARLIAKALNCTKNFSKGEKCKTGENCHCKDIVDSNHMDVLEMDAASKTGIDDVRELIENSKYSPTSAKYKIFIIDEVHMLSKQAFNGLLKTLEEPPPSLKFILATTEVRKIPVTILSRCQRFDLKRVNVASLCKHLDKISTQENGKISEDAIRLIARTSEGSVRDAVSLLDRALITQTINEEKLIEEKDVREMLGLADRNKILSLFKEVLSGKEKEALEFLRDMINNGIDAKNFLNDILEILYLFSRRISLGEIKKDMTVSENEILLIDQYSNNIDMQDIGLFWQLTIKTIDDLRIVGNENLALEMFIMQLVHLKNIEIKKEDLVDNFENNENKRNKNLIGENLKDEKLETKINQIKNQMKNIDQIKKKPIKEISINDVKAKLEITNFQDLINKATSEKEIELKYDLERNVKLVSFNRGKIDISFNEKLNQNFIKNLTEKLLLWTGERWIISLSKNNNAKSMYEKNLEKKSSQLETFEKSDISEQIKKAFPDAKLVDIVEETKND
tara:strand:- start:277 stop:1959 length:1683 start_codon:yes stop_codon:yes gene_type:complete